MALQGTLREFSATDILQLLATQKKTGCLILELSGQKLHVFVQDGRIVSSRSPGATSDDPLLKFLFKIHRLSSEQYRGIRSIQNETHRDLEDLLVNGRYLEAEELAGYIERQILDDLMKVARWTGGTYTFDPELKWTHAAVARLGIEGALIDVARRVDEHARFIKTFDDPQRLLGVRDLPDPSDPISEEESELFGIVDGRHTLAEIVEAAPLSDYEAHEALYRMFEAGWLEFVGRRDVTAPAPAPSVAATAAAIDSGHPLAPLDETRFHSRELVVAVLTAAAAFALWVGGHALLGKPATSAATDVFSAAQLRDVRYAVELYRRERGHYPQSLEDLVADRWLAPDQVRIDGRRLRYRPSPESEAYQLEMDSGR